MGKTQLNPSHVARDLSKKFRISSATGPYFKPAPQPSQPSIEEVNMVIDGHKKMKALEKQEAQKAAELLELQKLNSSKRGNALEATGKADLPEILVLSLGDRQKPKKKTLLLALNGGLIHRSISDMFDYYSGKKGHEVARVV